MLPIGSLIRLRPESEAAYRVLHRHVFPGVLERISRSNIRNYSIFLGGGILFSHLGYAGRDHRADMDAIAADAVTREWWILTDPMQVPLDEREPGSWWATMSLWHEQRRTENGRPTSRHAFVAPLPASAGETWDGAPFDLPGGDVRILRIFRSRECLYFYLESSTSDERSLAAALASALGLPAPPAAMEEVFHTDGLEAARPKVFVSGCFDLLHSGHVAFLREAASFGDLHVGIGSDATVHELKGRYTVNSQDERRYMIEALGCVTECRINRGGGLLDFEPELREIRPDVLVTNEDGHSPAKEALCAELGIKYRVLRRIPHAGLPTRSTTALRTESEIPYRIDLAGGWLDQPYVSKFHPGAVLTISIEPTIAFNDRSGMASSTRHKAVELWRSRIPSGDPETLAKVLFGFENPPGKHEVAGSQDALGIVLPGLNYLYYAGGAYWPSRIETVHDEEVLRWLEDRLHLVTLGPRVSSYTVLDDTRIDEAGARALAVAADDCWHAILARDSQRFGDAFRRSFEAQIAMFPRMVDEGILAVVERYRGEALGWKLSGAGGGGYLVLVSEVPVPSALRVKIRRRNGD
jgi:cytidyltransferase-like protein